MNKIKTGIVGGAGYVAGELIRLLLDHPHVEIKWAQSNSQAGKRVTSVHKDLIGETDLHFSSQVDENIDVLFLCMGHGKAQDFLATLHLSAQVKIIDMSQDFRLGELYRGQSFVYGLPEWNKTTIQKADYIANPGCFATAIQLALLPLATQNLLPKEVHISGMTGATGAGVALSETSHFSYRNNNLSVYKVFAHQHLNEINQNLRLAGQNSQTHLHFVPYRAPFTRGIWITAYLDTDISEQEAVELYEAFYEPHPFTHLSEGDLDLKQVVNTNKCLLYLEKKNGKLIVYSIIDNLLKGAAGQAVQNLNLMHGWNQTTALKLKAIAF